jgi:hypothetical protein
MGMSSELKHGQMATTHARFERTHLLPRLQCDGFLRRPSQPSLRIEGAIWPVPVSRKDARRHRIEERNDRRFDPDDSRVGCYWCVLRRSDKLRRAQGVLHGIALRPPGGCDRRATCLRNQRHAQLAIVPMELSPRCCICFRVAQKVENDKDTKRV